MAFSRQGFSVVPKAISIDRFSRHSKPLTLKVLGNCFASQVNSYSRVIRTFSTVFNGLFTTNAHVFLMCSLVTDSIRSVNV